MHTLNSCPQNNVGIHAADYFTNQTALKKITRHTQRVQTSAEHRMTQLVSNPEDPDFGLWTPGSEAMPYPSKKFRQNPFTSLRVIRRTDRQTDGQTDRQTDRTKNITSFFGGGNKHYHLRHIRFHSCFS